jgi:RNA polymerase sigma factor (TIGR02999 family)
MTPVTQPLDAAGHGDRQAARELLPLVYGDLRKLAAAKLADEAAGHSLDATALVHEVYLKLVGDRRFEGRTHFYATAAVAMRRILVDQARRARRSNAGAGPRVSSIGDPPNSSPRLPTTHCWNSMKHSPHSLARNPSTPNSWNCVTLPE